MFSRYDDQNVFAKILRDESPCIKLYEDQYTLAFMDIMPQTDGHVLVIPKEQAVTLYQLSDNGAKACMHTVKIMGKALEKAFATDGTTVFQHNGLSAGQTVPHIHFHVFPGSLMGIKGHAAEYEDIDVLEKTARKIIACIEQ